MATDTLAELYAGVPGARSLVENSVGYGVFSNINTQLMFFGTGNGYGVVTDTSDGFKTYMKMAEGGMMDMGGMEMDLRGGGFVPIGKKEKADDVPARLSKNEFVMTADAVRAAGGGSVDKGADLMYDTMKKLEAQV